MRSTLLGRLGATTAVAALLLAGAPPAGASATAAPTRGPRPHPAMTPHRTGVAAPATTASSLIDVVLPLHVSSATAAALQQVAGARLSVAARQTRLQALAPRTPQALAVRSWATRHGFQVVAATPYSVTLHGRAGALASAFGTTLGSRSMHGVGFVTPRTAPKVPSALRGTALGVVGLDTRPLFSPRTTYAGGDVQVLTSTPVRGKAAGAGTTVATVNLSGWHAGDLTTYWKAAFGPLSPTNQPPAVTPVLVGPGAHSAATALEDDFGMSTEVALDAQAIAGVAPSAGQRMYFAANSTAGYEGILTQMATDALAGSFQTASTSWGMCELGLTSTELQSMADAIHQITANGATFFAASGDSGAYGCGDGVTVSVDFPASAPDAVAVGGTRVTGTAPSYASTAWDGSGGGCSQFFTPTNTPVYAPEISRQGGPQNPCVGRAVPDIANLADPATGFWVYDHTNEWFPVGGTSLAAPASAAGLATVMSAVPLTKLAPNAFLDKAYANPTAFTDVTAGDNGLYRAGAGYDLVTGLGTPVWTAVEAALTGQPAPAITGHNEPVLAVDPTYDPHTAYLDAYSTGSTTLSGFLPNGEPVDGYAVAADCTSTTATPPSTAGLPGAEGPQELTLSVHTTGADPLAPACITVQRPVVVDSVSPVVTTVTPTFLGTTKPSYRFSWTTFDKSPSSGVIFSFFTLTDITTSTPRVIVDGAGTTGSAFPYPTDSPAVLSPGHRYRVDVDTFDAALNQSAAPRTVTFWTPYDDRSYTLTSGWTRANASRDFMGSHLYSARAGAAAATRFSGRAFYASFLKSRYGGYVDVYVDGVRKFRYSLYASSTLFRQQVRLVSYATASTHTVMLKVVGTHASGSSGSYVYLDGFTVV